MILLHIPVLWVAGPGDDWCAVIEEAIVGDIVMLHPGEYVGPCRVADLSPPDFPGETMTIRAVDPTSPPVLRGGGADHVLSVEAGLFTLADLHFADVPADGAAIRLGGGEIYALQALRFEVEGAAVQSVGDADQIRIVDTEVAGGALGFGIGCSGCVVADFEVRDVLVHGVAQGVLVAGGAVGEVRDGVIQAQGEALRFEGRGRVEENLLVGDERALRVEGDGVVVRNNIVIGQAPGWLAGEGLEVVGNTALGGLVVEGSGVRFEDNAFDGAAPGVQGAGNVACPEPQACWTAPESWDLYPAPGSPLRAGGVEPSGEPLRSDWCGRARGEPPTVGAFEALTESSYGPLELVFKRDFPCVVEEPEEPVDTGLTVDTGGLGEDTAPADQPSAAAPPSKPSGCGCASTPTGAGWLALAPLWLAGRRLLGLLALSLPLAASAHPVSTYVQGPDDDWCAFINEAYAGGDLILLEPGEYYGPCTIIGKPVMEDEETTLIQALDTVNPPRFVHDGEADYTLRVVGEHVGLYHLAFNEVPEGAAAVQVEGSVRFWLRFLDFRGVQGVAVEVLGGQDVRLQDTWLEEATVVFGCEDGSCGVSEVLFRGNLLEESRVVVHPGAWGTVGDNIGQGVEGPLVDYRGSGGAGLVQGNLLQGGGDALLVEADDVLVRNNIVVGGVVAHESVALLGNTFLGPVSGGALAGNALLADSAPSGNVACPTVAGCWVDAEGWDFRPVEGGPLWEAGVVDTLLEQDFCGTPRGSGPDAGALEHTEAAGPLIFELKARQPCAGLAPEVPEPEPEPEPEEPSVAGEEEGCGCAVGSGEGSWALLGLVGLVLARRRRSPVAARWTVRRRRQRL